ncbi:MAG: CDP-archaeol synthase [Alphaproteobacteria bacterium]
MEPDALHLLGLLLLLAVANGAPLLAKKAWGGALAWPLDGGMCFVDGRPVFGSSKTVRGVLVSVAATAAAAPLVGIAWWLGALIGATAMAGDLISSFIKRRLNRPPSSRALGLDHIPESLLPLLACHKALALTAADIAIVVAAFFVGAVVLSRLLYWVGLRDEPY